MTKQSANYFGHPE